MAQFQKGFEYDSSNPVKNIVTDDNLNALVANATLLNGAITEQTANSVTADTDIMLLSKAGGLIKQTKAQFTDTINSNIANINTVNAALVDADDVDTVDATLTGNLVVGGNSAMTGNLAVSGTLNVTGLVTASTVPTVGGHLTNKTYVDGTSSISANGWTRLPNGLIIQWGTHLTAMANYSASTVTFPIPFPTACFTVQLTARAVTTAANGSATLENGIKLNGTPTTTSFGVYVNWAGSHAGATIYPTWFAIGH